MPSDPTNRSTGTSDATGETSFDVIVVGTGFGGLYMLYRLLQIGLSVRAVDAASGVGGTWYWNRYPGARCDVESLEYSYSFSEALQQEWQWTERYAAQPEILRYLEHVADRFDLYPHIRFDTRVERMQFSEDSHRWTVTTSAGSLDARYCVMATGCLSAPLVPDIPGLESFGGEVHHTGRWPRDGVALQQRRIGVIGTGSSAIQSIPILAEQAVHLFVFQRTPNFSVPAGNHPLDPATQARMKARYAEFRKVQRRTPFAAGQPARTQSALSATPEERQRHYRERWDHGGLTFIGAFSDLLTDLHANATAADYVRERIRSLVDDPEIADRLCPAHPIGCKRLCSDSGYYQTFNRSNVTLVDAAADPIRQVTRSGIRTRSREYPVDLIVLASGFDAMTGALDRIEITGRSGRSLKASWHGGTRCYLGIACAGFPNLFLMTGPGSPSVLANMVTGVEQHAEWISHCIDQLLARGSATIEATEAAEDEWAREVNRQAAHTLFPACNSWYVGANVPGKPRQFLPYIGGFDRYEDICDEVAANGYPGFRISTPGGAADVP